MAKSHTTLSLNEKVKVIEAKEKEKLSVRDIMMKFRCGKTQIYEILKHKDTIINEWRQGNGEMKRAAKKTGNEEINQAVWEWFTSARAKNLQISGPMLQSQALAVAKSVGNDQFRASSGWLDSFKRRHNISWNVISGESKDVDVNVINEWKPKLLSLISDYEPKDIYNADETGLFYRALPTRSLVLKGEKCAGGKMSKERLTILLCGNMVGDLEKPVVIGKSAKPRCFKNMNLNNLPVVWRNNKKAWMTGSLMEEWLNAFNNKMKRENRKVMLFLDNATCHPKQSLSNVKLVFFPPNATSALQPMDMGVIYTFKSCYRRLLMQSLIVNVQEADSSYGLARSISVLDAVNWIGLATKQIKEETVIKCFNKAGFGERDSSDVMNEAQENTEAISALCREKNVVGAAENFIESDENLATHSTFESAADFLEQQNSDDEEKNNDEDGDGDEWEGREETTQPKVQTHVQAVECISDVMEFAVNSNNPNLLELLYRVKDCIEKDKPIKTYKQMSLIEAWKIK